MTDQGADPLTGASALELQRPHGFLLWRGKKAAIARPKGQELPAGSPLAVTTDGEAFGTAVLGEPVALPVLEFDGGKWFKDHRVYPRERNAWWPGATEFLVYPVAEFAPLEKPQWMKAVAPNYGPSKAPETCSTCLEYSDGFCRLHDQVVEDDHVCDDWDDFEDWRGGGGTDQGPVTKTEQVVPETARKAAEPALEDWRGGEDKDVPDEDAVDPEPDEDPAMIEQKQEAEAMPYEKRERDGEWCVFKAGEDEPMKCYGDESKADAYLTALRINVEAAEKAAGMTAEKAVEIAVRAQQIAEALHQGEDVEAILREYLHIKAAEDAVQEEDSETDEGESADPVTTDGEGMTTKDGQMTKERGQGTGTGGERQGDGGASTCVCPECGAETEHKRGTPCSDRECPECEVGLVGKSEGEPEKEEKAIPPEPDTASDTTGDTSPDDAYSADNIEAQPAGDKDGDGSSAQKAGRRVKKPMLDRVKDALKTLREFVGWAEYEDEQQEGAAMAPFFKMHTDHGMTVKEVDGQPMMLTWTTNAFKDRQKEIFSTMCLEQYVLEAEQKGDRGTYDLWHIPGTDFAKVQWSGVIGRYLVEFGPFLDTPIGHKAKAFFTNHPDGHPEHAPEGWGSSPEFRYLPEERKAGVYNWIWIVRRAVLPRAAAANVWTKGTEVGAMALTKQQKKLAEDALGAEEFAQIVDESEARSKDLEEAGIAHKASASADGAETEVEETEAEEVEQPDKASSSDEATKEDPEGDPEVEKAESTQVEVDVKAVAEQLASIFEVKLEPLQDMAGQIGTLAKAFEGLDGRMKALEGEERVKKEAETPRFVLNLATKASEAEETLVEDDDPLLKMKPVETERPKESGAANFFTGK